MRCLRLTLVAALLLAVVATAQAQTVEQLRDQVKALQDQLKVVMDKLQQLEAKPAPPAAPPADVPKWTDKITVNGYWHARYEARENARDDFTFRRMYINFLGKLNDRTSIIMNLCRVPLANDPTIEFEAAQVNYQLDDLWMLSFGQVYNNFGWDTWESSSKRLPLDRWAAGEGISGRPDRAGIRGLYFAGPTDRGMYVTRKGQDMIPTVIVGLVNGNFRAADNNDNKTYSLDLRWKQPWGQFGASWMDGDYTETVGGVLTTNARKALGLYVHTDPAPWGFQAEFLDGDLFGHPVQGWYGQVAYNKGGKGTPYFRYEQYDTDQDSAGNTFMGFRAGYAYQLDKNNELTVEWQDADYADMDYGQFGFQWQLGF